MADYSTEQLGELIHRKRQVLVQLRDVGRRQGELIAAGEITTLLTLLSAKQKLLAELQIIEQRLAPFREEDPERRQWDSPAHRAACAEVSQECQQLLAEVMELERNCERLMLARRNETAAQLQEAQPARAAVGAYAQHRRPTSPLLPPHFAAGPEAHLDLLSAD